MTRHSPQRSLPCATALSIAALLLYSNIAWSQVLFEEDFSGRITGDPSPVWSFSLDSDVREGMMLGEDDVYEVVTTKRSLSHGRALRMNLGGRNGFCNQCGGDYTEVLTVNDNEACIRADAKDHQDYVYNLTNYFSTWTITNESGREICFDTSEYRQPSMGNRTSEVREGDSIFLPTVCGVSGRVGNDPNRRSDCNKAVNYFQNISSEHFQYGDTLSRRFYVYFSEEAQLPSETLKLAYSYWQTPGDKVRAAQLNISVQREMTFSLLTPSRERVTRSAKGSPRFEREQWYYIEELFKRESAAGAEDGSYTLYASPAGDFSKIPIVHIENFDIGELRRMSIGGNWQHHNDVSGYVYFDNIRIAKEFSGPINPPVMGKQPKK